MEDHRDRLIVVVAGYPELMLEDVLNINPDSIVLVYDAPPGSDDVDELAGALAVADIAAARDGRIAVLVHRDALMPSTGIVEVAAALKKALAGFETATNAANEADG